MAGPQFDGRLRRPASIYDMQYVDEWGNPMPAIRLSSLMPPSAAVPHGPPPRVLKEKDVSRLAYLRRKLQRPLSFTHPSDPMSPARTKQMELFYRRNKARGQGCSSSHTHPSGGGRGGRLRSWQEMTTSPGGLQVAGMHRAERVLPVLQVLPRKCQEAMQLQQRLLDEYFSASGGGPLGGGEGGGPPPHPVRLFRPPPPPGPSHPSPVPLVLEEGGGGILRSQPMQIWRATPEPGFYNARLPPRYTKPGSTPDRPGHKQQQEEEEEGASSVMLSTGSVLLSPASSHHRQQQQDTERSSRRQQQQPPVTVIPSRAPLSKGGMAAAAPRPDTALSAVMRPWEAMPASPPLTKGTRRPGGPEHEEEGQGAEEEDDGTAASSWHMDDRSIEQARNWLDADD